MYLSSFYKPLTKIVDAWFNANLVILELKIKPSFITKYSLFSEENTILSNQCEILSCS